MAMQPPFLWEGRPGPGLPVTIEYDVDSSIAVLAVRGLWNAKLNLLAARALRKCFAESPSALILDLTELDDEAAASVSLWITARVQAAALEPQIRLALCISPELVLADRMQRMGASRFLPVYARVRQARVALAGGLPLADQLTRVLKPAAGTAATAGALAVEACRSWQLWRLARPARIVVAELVGNAVEHAGTEVTLRITRRPTSVNIVVADRDPRLPRLAEPPPPGPERGMHLVHTAATSWGAMPTADGKIVWATVRDVA